MDFSLIRNKLNRFEYLQPSDLLLDVLLIFANCKEYNMPTAPVFAAGQQLEAYFQKRLRELKLTSLLSSSSSANSSEGTVLPRELRKRTLWNGGTKVTRILDNETEINNALVFFCNRLFFLGFLCSTMEVQITTAFCCYYVFWKIKAILNCSHPSLYVPASGNVGCVLSNPSLFALALV